MVETSSTDVKRELADIKSLLILILQAAKFSNEDIGRALGVSAGRVSQLVDKQKYPQK